MADAIARIVSEIQFLCRMHHHDVNPTLAAFIARAVVLENATQFPLDKELNEKDVKDLIKLSTERLLESDSPSLETVKMQVGFDTARVEETATLDLARAEREQRESALVREICATRLKPGNDVEALTSLYRKIFNFLVLRAGLDAGGNRPAEREIAAALESVFPRVGLKAFTALPPDDKTAQLHELSNIVSGIRLFNRHIGKGGAGISDLPTTCAELVAALINKVAAELESVETLCAQYVDVIAHQYRAASGAGTRRLQLELTNRRQYAACLSQLDGAFKQSGEHVEQLARLLVSEMDALKELVGSRASVPKEQVYPRFDSLARLWASFEEELQVTRARQTTLATLATYQDSYVPTLRSDDLVAARQLRRAEEAMGEMPPPSTLPPVDEAAVAEALAAGDTTPAGAAGAMDEEKAERVSGDELVDATLELSGFCLGTIVVRDAMLLPASANIVASFRGRYFGFADDASLERFVAAPARHVRALLRAARKAPELIHMLRLQEHFPASSIAEIMRNAALAAGGASKSLLAPTRSFADSCVQTPTHFVEKNIDVDAQWNEWALRRRAVQLANLRLKRTTAQQTQGSSMRRDVEAQVYPSRDSETQTGVQAGTAAPISRSFVAGLRGSPDLQVRVVNLTLS
jgi:hypothetical protein